MRLELVLCRTLKYVDYRMAFHGKMSRSQIEQELTLSAPICLPVDEKAHSPVKDEDDVEDNDVEEVQDNCQSEIDFAI